MEILMKIIPEKVPHRILQRAQAKVFSEHPQKSHFWVNFVLSLVEFFFLFLIMKFLDDQTFFPSERSKLQKLISKQI